MVKSELALLYLICLCCVATDPNRIRRVKISLHPTEKIAARQPQRVSVANECSWDELIADLNTRFALPPNSKLKLVHDGATVDSLTDLHQKGHATIHVLDEAAGSRAAGSRAAPVTLSSQEFAALPGPYAKLEDYASSPGRIVKIALRPTGSIVRHPQRMSIPTSAECPWDKFQDILRGPTPALPLSLPITLTVTVTVTLTPNP